jgi:hypothetical protein
VAYCVATSVADLVLTGASFAASDYRLMLAGGALTWLWASAVSARLLADTLTFAPGVSARLLADTR